MQLSNPWVLLATTIAILTNHMALAGSPLGEDCPQGRQIRVQKSYPPSMSDCDVLDADTARENQRIQRRPSAAFVPTNQPVRTADSSQKAILYEEDPAFPPGRQFIGAVIWRTEPVKESNGRTDGVAIRADIEIPERKLKMTMSLRRNTDTSLPASHTVELSFTPPSNTGSGGVSGVSGILMKSGEQTRGSPLVAQPVKITNTFFIIGLPSTAADRVHNLELLEGRSWFDVPIVYSNGRRAILSFKKGPSGQHAFDQAFMAWNEEIGGQESAAASAKEDDPNSLTVKMSVTSTSTNPPVITGATNLPNGTILSVFMFGEQPACMIHCLFGSVDATVEDGHFEIGAKLTGTKKLLTNTYKVDVTMMSHQQSDPFVKSVLGPNGENLRGSYVVASGSGPGATYIPIEFPRSSPPSEGERYLGLMIHFVQRISVAGE